jgi:methylated-DNA-protein-cysteine methyltransferase-like protein
MKTPGAFSKSPEEGAPMQGASSSYQRIYEVVARIPRGRVATYGQIAQLAGLAGHARQVGYALHRLPDGARLPWHRVVNAQGRVSPRSFSGSEGLQRQLLEEEGIVFGLDQSFDLERHRWRPRGVGVTPRDSPCDGT